MIREWRSLLASPTEGLAMIIVATPAWWNLFLTPATAAVTWGRVELIGLWCGLGIFLLSGRRPARPSRQLGAFVAAVALLALVIVISVGTRGVSTSGALEGYVELGVALVGLSLALDWGLVRRPRFLWAAALGAAIIAVLALAGVNQLHTSLVPVVERSDRLGGSYGIPTSSASRSFPRSPLSSAGSRAGRGSNGSRRLR